MALRRGNWWHVLLHRSSKEHHVAFNDGISPLDHYAITHLPGLHHYHFPIRGEVTHFSVNKFTDLLLINLFGTFIGYIFLQMFNQHKKVSHILNPFVFLIKKNLWTNRILSLMHSLFFRFSMLLILQLHEEENRSSLRPPGVATLIVCLREQAFPQNTRGCMHSLII